MRRNWYVVGRAEGEHCSYYAEGFGVAPTWTRRESANQYSNKRAAIREAKRVGGTIAEPYHHPFGMVLAAWTA